MKYQKPKAETLEVRFIVSTASSDRTSCEGGHCVKATYQNDPWGMTVPHTKR